MVSIRNDRGEEISRQVVGVGALSSAEQRTFTLAVEVYTPEDAKVGGNGSGREIGRPSRFGRPLYVFGGHSL